MLKIDSITSHLPVIRPQPMRLMAAQSSFVAQGHHRIDPRCPAGGDIAGQKCSTGHQQRDKHKNSWICRANPIEQPGKESRKGEGPGDPDSNADRREDHTLANYLPNDVAAPRP